MLIHPAEPFLFMTLHMPHMKAGVKRKVTTSPQLIGYRTLLSENGTKTFGLFCCHFRLILRESNLDNRGRVHRKFVLLGTVAELSGTGDVDDEDAFDRHRAYFIFFVFCLFVARLVDGHFPPASIPEGSRRMCLWRFRFFGKSGGFNDSMQHLTGVYL